MKPGIGLIALAAAATVGLALSSTSARGVTLVVLVAAAIGMPSALQAAADESGTALRPFAVGHRKAGHVAPSAI